MKLYYAAGACSLASHIMLNEVGAAFDIEAVDTKAGRTASGQDYHAINPNGYVPALETDEGDHLAEGVAILQYIADRHPEKAFSPQPGSLARARMQQYLNFAASELHKTWTPLFSDNASPEARDAARRKVATRFDFLEAELADGRAFLVEGMFSPADAYTFVLANWANAKDIDLSAWPNLEAYVARIQARPATRAAMTAEGLI